jgi:hypothetical protein
MTDGPPQFRTSTPSGFKIHLLLRTYILLPRYLSAAASRCFSSSNSDVDADATLDIQYEPGSIFSILFEAKRGPLVGRFVRRNNASKENVLAALPVHHLTYSYHTPWLKTNLCGLVLMSVLVESEIRHTRSKYGERFFFYHKLHMWGKGKRPK